MGPTMKAPHVPALADEINARGTPAYASGQADTASFPGWDAEGQELPDSPPLVFLTDIRAFPYGDPLRACRYP